MLFFLLLPFLPFHLQATDYFIHLTQRGFIQRQALLNRTTAFSNKLNRPAGFHIRLALQSRKWKQAFENWLQISDFSGQGLAFIKQLKTQQLIDSAEPVKAFKISNISQDTLQAKQWYRQTVHIQKAWNYTRGRAQIIVGLIDTGVDYHHPDLKGCFWVNQREAEGKPGVDDDGNGFVDDSLGWDFTDAPRFADGGDYKDPDNDPMDEFGSGHGTQIAGIIAAQNHEGQGIWGLAPGLRIMVLRAGTASGYLEEDDVARAIIYALDNGARILNMSFGDVALSRFLRDVIYFAYSKGMVMIASSGNSGNDQIQYPSALKETISVGATNRNDDVTGFSTYGSTLDLVAPGAEMFSTAIGGGYNSVNGTSFSAPVVSAVAGLILSLHPDYSPERLRNVLKTSAKDLYSSGWDLYSAAGRVDAAAALAVRESGILQLTSPKPNASTAADTLWLVGSLVHPDLLSASVAYGLGSNPTNWNVLKTFVRQQVFNDTLAGLPVKNLPDTLVTLRLQMNLVNHLSDQLRRLVAIDRSAPQIDGIRILPLYDGPRNALLISFNSDDVCSAKLFLRKKGASAFNEVIESRYETRTQRFKIDSDTYSGSYQFYVEAKNYSGLTTRMDNLGFYYTFDLQNNFDRQEFTKLNRRLPAGYFLDSAQDLDGDGQREVLLSAYDAQGNFGPVQIYEFTNNHFVKRLETAFTAIPRAAGDVDGDGLSDMLLGYGNRSYLFEAQSKTTFPTKLVWYDTTDFWAAGYADLDQDGKGELVGRVDSQYVVLENTGPNRFTEIARLPNTSAGGNRYGIPKIQITDLNGDAKPDLIFGDYDGDLLAYTAVSDNRFGLLATGHTSLLDATALLSAVTLGNGRHALFAGSHTSDDLDYENEFDARRWAIERFVFKQGKLTSEDTLNLFGYRNLRDFDSSIQVASLGDATYLFAACYPNIYVFKMTDKGLKPVWQRSDARSNAVLVADFDGDGEKEFYYNTGQEIVCYGRTRQNRPPAPYPFTVSALDSQRILLKWGRVGSASDYAVYRGLSPDSLMRRKMVQQTAFTDTCPGPGPLYYYAVSALDSSYPIPESLLSAPDSVQTDWPPKLLALHIANERQLILSFDKKVQLSSAVPFKIMILHSPQQATSALILKNQKDILCGFSQAFKADRPDTLRVEGIFDLNGVPLDARYNRLPFTYQPGQQAPYIAEVQLPDRYRVILYFNQPMQKEGLLKPDNYRLSPSGRVLKVVPQDSAYTQIELRLSRQSLNGAFGKAAYLQVENLFSRSGLALKNGAKINLFRPVENLARLVVYPQPLRPGQKALIFAKLPQFAEIQIFNLQGMLIKKISQPSRFGGIRWNLHDENGQPVHSGIYLYRIRFKQQEKIGKIIILR